MKSPTNKHMSARMKLKKQFMGGLIFGSSTKVIVASGDPIEREYLTTGEIPMEDNDKREKVRIKDISLRGLSLLKPNDISLLVIDELEAIGVRVPAKPKKPRKPMVTVKYNSAINKIRELSKDLDNRSGGGYYSYSSPSGSQVASYKKKIDKLLGELVSDRVKMDAEYADKTSTLKPKLDEYDKLFAIYKSERKDYEDAKNIYDKTKEGLVNKIAKAKTNIKFVEKCAKKYLSYLDVANSDRDIAFKFLVHEYPKIAKIEGFRSHVLDYVLATKNAGG